MENSPKITAVILAAGKGTRMKSSLPKVLHKAGGRTMLGQVLHQVRAAGIKDCCVVVGHGAEEVRAALPKDANLCFALQMPQLGTGHCVQQAMPHISADCSAVLIVCGDTPLLTAETLAALCGKFTAEAADGLILTADFPNPTGYGRIIRNAEGNVCSVVEEKDATDAQKAVTEINTGAYIFRRDRLEAALAGLDNNNAQGEYYLTDVIKLIAEAGGRIDTLTTANPIETTGVNDRVQLAAAAAELYRRKATELMLGGVTVIDPANTYIDQQVTVGQDTVIYPGCHLRGATKIGSGCVLDVDCTITDSQIGNNCTLTKCVLNQAEVKDGANIGPFAYLRPGTRLAENVKIGDFAEIKNSVIGAGSKVPHLSYIGDADVGSGVNIGCGTITCNYDGVNKFRTVIGDNVFIGSNSNLVAPVSVGAGAFVGAGSTITKDIPGDALAVERTRQTIVAGWAAEKSPKALAKKTKKEQ